jgi:ATP phosphoribosyltransferase regulatory subunit
VDALEQVGVTDPVLDLGCARVLRSVLQPIRLSRSAQAELHDALAAKDRSTVHELLASHDAAIRDEVVGLIDLYGGPEVVAQAQARFAHHPERAEALATLAALVQGIQAQRPSLRLSVDLADLRGYAYYSGPRFSVYARGLTDALARGGRYDEVGAVFGRRRAAVGFSLDVRQLADVAPAIAAPQAILAPALSADQAAWAPSLALAVATLRRQGEVVVCALPGHDDHVAELACDRVLAPVPSGSGAAASPGTVHVQWVVRAL